MTPLETSRLAGMALVLFLGSSLAGCAHVKPEELDSELAALRTEIRGEMTDGQTRMDGRLAALEGRMEGVDARLTTLERQLTEMGRDFDAAVQRVEGALRFNMPVYFDFDRAELEAEHREILDRFAGVVREYYPDCLITAEGFTDPVGDPDYNVALGLRRAEAVRKYLVESGGLSPTQVRSVSYGEAQNRLAAPDQHGPGDRGWENRRVALVVDHGGA